MDQTADLIAELQMAREHGGYEQFEVADEDGRKFEIVDVTWPGNNLPAVLLIRSTE